MAQKALSQIQAAEAEAEQIRSGAAGQAEALRSDAHARGKALLAENGEAIREMRKARLGEADAKAAALIEEGTKSATDEAARLTERSSARLDEASQLILERIRSLWQ